MSMYLRLEALDGTGVTLIDAAAGTTPLDPVVQTGTDWGNPQWEAAFSGPRGTLGRTGLQTQVSDRDVTLVVRFYGTSMDDLASRIAGFARVVEEVRRQGGGRIIRRVHTAGVKATLRVTATRGMTTGAWTARSETLPRRDVTVGFTCAPFWEGDSMDSDTAFSSPNPVSWTYNPASPSGVTQDAAGLRRTGSAADLFILPDTYETADHQVTATFIAGGNAGQAYGCVGRWRDSNNYVRARLVGTALTVSGIVAGSVVVTNSVTVTAPTAGQRFTLRLTVHSDGARVDFFGPGVWVVDAAAPTATTATVDTLVGVGGFGVAARPGVLFNTNNQTDNARVVDVQVRPYTVDYTGTLPTVMAVRGVPGDAPALAELHVTARQDFEFGLIGWRQAPRAGTMNLLDDGEVFGGYPTSKWWGLGGGTVTKQTTGGRTGSDHLQVSATTTNPSGIQRTLEEDGWMAWPRRLRTVECWVRSASSTETVVLAVGSITDSVTLSQTWQKLSVTFIRTVTSPGTIQIRKTGTSTAVFQVDDIAYYDGPANAQQQPNAAPAPFGVLKAVNVPNEGVSPVDASAYTSPSFLVDGGRGGDLVEVWGRVALHSTVVSATARLRLRHESGIGDPQWAIETGVAGRPIAVPGATQMRLIRYGTLRLPAGRCYIEPIHTYRTTATATATGNASNAASRGIPQWTNPANATNLDGSLVTATPTPSVSNSWECTPSVPGGVNIQNVIVRFRQASFNVATADIWVALTTDNFATMTAGKFVNPGFFPADVSTDGNGDPLWGRAWAPGDFANLKVVAVGRAIGPGAQLFFDQLQVDVVYETNQPAVESIILVPTRARAVTPTGVASTRWASYPGGEYRKVVAADLSGRSMLTGAEASGWQATPGMGGSLIELPPGDVDTLVKLSPSVPDGVGEQPADPLAVEDAAIHWSVTPRWTVMREDT